MNNAPATGSVGALDVFGPSFTAPALYNAGVRRKTRPVSKSLRVLSVPVMVGAALALAACGGAGGHDKSTPVPSASPSPDNSVLDGHLRFTVLSLKCGIQGVTGTHSEAGPSNGQFCEAKLRVVNTDPDYHSYVPVNQRLEGDMAADTRHPDGFAMSVRRQSLDPVQIQGSDAIEVELWYDISATAKVTGLRVQGDADPAGFLDNTPVKHSADGIVIPLAPTMMSVPSPASTKS